MKIDLSLEGEQVTAAVVTMVLAACADLNVSAEEVARVKEIVVQRTSWADDRGAEALIETAHDRIRDISQLSDDHDKLRAALAVLGTAIGDVSAREIVLGLAEEVASVDGLDDDERSGLDMLIDAFGADSARVHELARGA